jgi:hypothetical protein
MTFSKLMQQWPLIIFIFFCFLAFVRFFYFTFFFARLAFYKAKPKTSYRTNAVSVIICARDEAANIAKNLPGILVQNYNSTQWWMITLTMKQNICWKKLKKNLNNCM